jgi:hypothetical protein
MSMRDQIAEIIILEELLLTYQELADEIVAALPDMIAPLVWELKSPDDQPYWLAKGYKIQSMPHDTWEWNGCFFTGPNAAKAAANAHHRAAIMAAFTGETTT